MILFIFIIISIIFITFIFYNKYNQKIEGLNTFTGRLAIDDQYFYDKLFDDVAYYPNNEDGTTGWVTCKMECPGNCVEFGINGQSYCFPY